MKQKSLLTGSAGLVIGFLLATATTTGALDSSTTAMPHMDKEQMGQMMRQMCGM